MNIDLGEYYETDIGNLQWGDIFEFGGTIFMMIIGEGTPNNLQTKFYCVNIGDGSLHYLPRDIKVKELKFEAVLRGD